VLLIRVELPKSRTSTSTHNVSALTLEARRRCLPSLARAALREYLAMSIPDNSDAGLAHAAATAVLELQSNAVKFISGIAKRAAEYRVTGSDAGARDSDPYTAYVRACEVLCVPLVEHGLCDGSVLRARYREKIRSYHPDRNPNDAAANERVQVVVHAYRVILDYHAVCQGHPGAIAWNEQFSDEEAKIVARIRAALREYAYLWGAGSSCSMDAGVLNRVDACIHELVSCVRCAREAFEVPVAALKREYRRACRGVCDWPGRHGWSEVVNHYRNALSLRTSLAFDGPKPLQQFSDVDRSFGLAFNLELRLRA
jgi:hypothetical protein